MRRIPQFLNLMLKQQILPLPNKLTVAKLQINQGQTLILHLKTKLLTHKIKTVIAQLNTLKAMRHKNQISSHKIRLYQKKIASK